MPYVVIEAAAAGVPMIAANVGGIPEIFGSHHNALFAPNTPSAIAAAITMAMAKHDAALERAKALRERIFLHFSQNSMVEGVIAGYREAFAKR
jgi:glycosyltransferase involved in cell wall biosynthesis